MRGVPRSLGATPWLAATVAILLPTLAWLQYDWVNQLATADRERRERTLRAAGAQFTAAVDAEVSRLGGGLQLDGAMVERHDWDAYALRYDAAIDGGTSVLEPQVWFAEIDESAKTPEARIALRHWNPADRTFESVEWPGDLQALRTQLLAVPPHEAAGERRGPREVFAAVSGVGDERTLVMPILRVQTPRAPGQTPDRFVTDVQMRGYTIVPLDLHWKGGRAKLDIGLAKGKKQHDKRATEKDRDWQRDKVRFLKRG